MWKSLLSLIPLALKFAEWGERAYKAIRLWNKGRKIRKINEASAPGEFTDLAK